MRDGSDHLLYALHGARAADAAAPRVSMQMYLCCDLCHIGRRMAGPIMDRLSKRKPLTACPGASPRHAPYLWCMNTKRRGRNSAAEWSKIVASWRASGETSRIFAERHGLSAKTLLCWSSRLLKESERSRRAKSPAKTPGFTRVRVTSTSVAPEGGRMEVVARGGRVIRWEGSVDADALRAALQAVESC